MKEGEIERMLDTLERNASLRRSVAAANDGLDSGLADGIASHRTRYRHTYVALLAATCLGVAALNTAMASDSRKPDFKCSGNYSRAAAMDEADIIIAGCLQNINAI